MLRQPLKTAQRQAVARTYTMAAPVLGLNGRDALPGMDPRYALRLDNWFPSTNQLVGRAGSAAWATGLGSASVETLVAYTSGATKKMLAWANHAVYDATSSGAVGAALDSGYSNNRWQVVNYKGFLIGVNGTTDGCKKYDGATVSANSVTGATGNLANVAVFQNRLFFLDNTLTFYFLATQAISGALSPFDLSTYCRFGGFLMAMGTWSYLGTDSINAYAVFISSEGEVIVFSGTDPTSASTWSMAAQFRIGRPVGRRCMMELGSDLIIITEDGFVPVSSLMGNYQGGADRVNPAANLSDALGALVTQDIHSYGGNFGWEGTLFPLTSIGPMCIFNVPSAENSSAYQYVMNLRTRAWCRFIGLNANTWCYFNGGIFFGGNDGKVYQQDTGTADSGNNITFDGKTAFSYMQDDDADRVKDFKFVRPIISSNGTIGPAIIANVDFEDSAPTSSPTVSGQSGSPWDTSPWDTSPWASDLVIQKNWLGVSGLGYAAALRMQIATKNFSVSWASTDWMYEAGGPL